MDIIITSSVHSTFVTLPLIAICVMSRHPPYLDPGNSDYIQMVSSLHGVAGASERDPPCTLHSRASDKALRRFQLSFLVDMLNGS